MSGPGLCEDCRQQSDLGNKCRACYVAWKQRLWADIPDHQADITKAAVLLNRTNPQSLRKDVARHALGEKGVPEVTGKPAELVALCKRVLEGPFGPQMHNKLTAIVGASEEASAAKAPRKDGLS